MTPSTVIRDATADGLVLTVSSNGKLKATGVTEAVNRWIPIIREHKAAIIKLLTSPFRQPSQPMPKCDLARIRAWLAHIEEFDPATIAHVLDQCKRDSEARDYFMQQAALIAEKGK
jgi:hypothetical protein